MGHPVRPRSVSGHRGEGGSQFPRTRADVFAARRCPLRAHAQIKENTQMLFFIDGNNLILLGFFFEVNITI